MFFKMAVSKRTHKITFASMIAAVSVLLLAFFSIHQQHGSLRLQSRDLATQEAYFFDNTILETKLGSVVPSLFGRVAATLQEETSDEDWSKAVVRGGTLMCLLPASIDAANSMLSKPNQPVNSQSKWTDKSVFATWGWEVEPTYNMDEVLYGDDFDDIFDEIGVVKSDSVAIGVRQSKAVIVDGKTYIKSNGYYRCVYNGQAGLIIADDNLNPLQTDKTKDNPSAVVLLRQWSDLVFLQWKDVAGADIKNLQFVFRANVMNRASKAAIYRALSSTGQVLQDWDHKAEIGMDTEAGRAILSTPNGNGIAWLLINHKEQLGIKTVESVAIWADNAENPNPDLCLRFKIVDVPS